MPPKKRRQKVQTATAAAKAHSQDTTRLINQALAEGNVSRSLLILCISINTAHLHASSAPSWLSAHFPGPLLQRPLHRSVQLKLTQSQSMLPCWAVCRPVLSAGHHTAA
jgi:hypothetical protein